MKRPWLLCLALTAIGGAFPSPAAAQTRLFFDDFRRTTGLGRSWQVAYGGFTTDGTFAVASTPPTNGNWAKAIPTQDYSVSADIVLPAGSRYSGVVARSSDPIRFDRELYAAQLSTTGTVNLYRRNEWTWMLLSSVPAGIVANTAYSLRLVVSGYDPAVHLEVWVNGTRRISVDDTSVSRIARGRAGIENYDAGVKYANFAIDAGAMRLFSDAFDRGTGLGAKWQTAYGGFTTDGTYAISGTPPVNGNWANVVPVYGTDDYSVTADLIVPSGSTYSGIVARSSDPVEFDRDLYAAQLAANGTVNLYRRNAWGWTLLRSVAAGIVSNTRYTVKLVTSGYDPAVHLEVWVNGTQRISFDDTSSWRLAGGSAGMENYNASVKYTNFSVDAIGTTPPPTSYTVNVSVTGSGSVTSSPSGINCPSGSCSMAVTSGTNVTLTATPAAGYAFQGWGGACTGTGTCSL